MDRPNSQRKADPNGTEGDAFVAWWNTQDTKGLSDACRWSAWNAWVASAYRSQPAGPAERDAVLEAAANAVFIHYQECASDQPAEQYMNGLLNAMQLIRALKNAAPQVPASRSDDGMELLKLREREIENTANELDQMFRQRHTMADVEHLLKRLVNRCTPVSEQQRFIAVGYIDHQGCARWEPNKDPSCLNPDQLIYVSHLPQSAERPEGSR